MEKGKGEQGVTEEEEQGEQKKKEVKQKKKKVKQKKSKMTNTAAANLVGKLFFNVVQTKCFVLKPRKVCLRMSWWGKCEKYGVRKQAHLRNNVPY
ncbi:Uncharacterized protein GBIM_15728 [Gryllus bimaculatus]|nr:Uncharacterized protein GBIM_15728 [Gryllus bimaculatus]